MWNLNYTRSVGGECDIVFPPTRVPIRSHSLVLELIKGREKKEKESVDHVNEDWLEIVLDFL